jgi:hypothetical protein
MADFTVANVGEKLIVGQLDMSFLTASDKITPGTAVINGPCYIGLTPQIGVARATCMIGPPVPGLTVPASLEVTGIANFVGDTNTIGISKFFGISTKLAADISTGVKVNSGAHISTENKVITGNLNVTENVTAVQYFGNISACTGKKDFDIPHPSKPGWRLRHVCIEGPSADVFIRGQLVNNNAIELPHYWRNLVDAETITVQLTPTEVYQELFVDRIEWGNKIYIKNNSGSAIKCHYIVYGERKDTSKNIPEYEGNYQDYPGNNDEYILSAIRS